MVLAADDVGDLEVHVVEHLEQVPLGKPLGAARRPKQEAARNPGQSPRRHPEVAAG